MRSFRADSGNWWNCKILNIVWFYEENVNRKYFGSKSDIRQGNKQKVRLVFGLYMSAWLRDCLEQLRQSQAQPSTCCWLAWKWMCENQTVLVCPAHSWHRHRRERARSYQDIALMLRLTLASSPRPTALAWCCWRWGQAGRARHNVPCCSS